MSDSSYAFSATEHAAVYRAITERRDMRRLSGGSVAPELLAWLLEAAHQTLSASPMQSWRFIRTTEPALRRVIHGLVEDERGHIVEALGERFDEFMRLKVEGVLGYAELLIVALIDDHERHVFGCRTLPQTDLVLLACAIQNLQLASRAEGLGMGWVSLFDPAALGELLGLPSGSEAVTVLCLGPVVEFYPASMLALEGWNESRPLAELVYQNRWGERVRAHCQVFPT